MEFENLYHHYSPKIFRLCLGYFNDVHQAKDITQETFITVFEQLKNLKNQNNISGWIFKIATNKCLRQIENENRKQSVYNYDFSLHETKEVPDLEENFANLQKYIFELEEIDRIIIGLYLEDLTQLKIADIVGLSHGNIRVKIHRIKENLAKKMKTNE